MYFSEVNPQKYNQNVRRIRCVHLTDTKFKNFACLFGTERVANNDKLLLLMLNSYFCNLGKLNSK